jgi:uncharacterized protein YbcV (DUF1398 family)
LAHAADETTIFERVKLEKIEAESKNTKALQKSNTAPLDGRRTFQTYATMMRMKRKFGS